MVLTQKTSTMLVTFTLWYILFCFLRHLGKFKCLRYRYHWGWKTNVIKRRHAQFVCISVLSGGVIREDSAYSIAVVPTSAARCPRCRRYSAESADCLCPRCNSVVSQAHWPARRCHRDDLWSSPRLFWLARVWLKVLRSFRSFPVNISRQ